MLNFDDKKTQERGSNKLPEFHAKKMNFKPTMEW